MVALTGPKTANLAIIEGFLTPVPTHLTDQSQILKARVDPWSTLMCQILFESVYAEYCIFSTLLFSFWYRWIGEKL